MFVNKMLRITFSYQREKRQEGPETAQSELRAILHQILSKMCISWSINCVL
jgi:hypothetical protein